MMKATGLLFLFGFFYIMAAAQKPYWQQQVNYTISVSLNDREHSLEGQETMEYFNNSGDTLHFIWIHLWANACKNDRTAFTEQLLQNGSTDFYFSNEQDKGYINRLAFKVNGSIAVKEDHPQHQDIIKLLLPSPLPPKQSCKIETAFHVQLPYNFSRGGHIGQSYQVTQWYPKAAVYDKKGWHEMPYLDQGEFYSDFGNYEVSITLPENYIVAATGELIKESTQPATGENKVIEVTPAIKEKKPFFARKKQPAAAPILSSHSLKTLVYKQNDVIDFAWFADKRFIVKKDTLALPSGREISVAAYSLPATGKNDVWKNAVQYIKKAVLSRSNLIGEYPYSSVTVVQSETAYGGGMEYPTITVLSGLKKEKELESVIEHEVGHNWFYGILATNEREYPWMDEGMNTYYNHYRYTTEPEPAATKKKNEADFWDARLPRGKQEMDDLMLRYAASEKMDQPIETSSEEFSAWNYELSAYYKASKWMQWLETRLGKELFDSCMREYYRQWKFKHPYPEDFIAILRSTAKRDVITEAEALGRKGYMGGGIQRDTFSLHDEKTMNNVFKRPVKLASFFSFKHTDKYKYLFVSPAIGYNMYDKLMIGALLHNYTLPQEKLQFLIAPLYATGSKQLNGIAKLNYHWFNLNDNRIELGVNFSHFSSKYSIDSNNKKVFESFYKTVPYVQYHLKKDPHSKLSRWFDLRTFIITEKVFDGFDTAFRPAATASATRHVNQLTYNAENTRALYPYSYQLQMQQGDGFVRGNATGNYFFNYGKTGGMQLRLFASMFRFTGNNKATAYLYEPKLMAANGTDDYTYSNYFLGRTASTSNGETPVKNAGVAAQQVMIQNSGGLKFRTDMFSSIQGYSEKWVAAINLNSTLPENLFPVKLPLKIYFDVGSYSEAWQKNSNSSKFLYAGGLQLSLLKNVLNIYAPLIYSSAIKNELKTDPANNTFFKRITFSIDIQNLTLKKMFPQFAF